MPVEVLMTPTPRGRYGSGDFVSCKDAGAVPFELWGLEELSGMWIMRVEDRDAAFFSPFLVSGATSKRQYNLDPPRLSSALRNQLTTTGRISGVWADFEAAVNNKGN